MIKKIKNALLAFAAVVALGAPALAPAATVYAANNATQKYLCSGTNLDVSGGKTGDCGANVNQNKLSDLATNIVNILSVIVGVIAVIMIVVGGLRYITSGGDSTKVGNAKNTIIYALVGLVIVALAQFIVHFSLGQTTKLV